MGHCIYPYFFQVVSFPQAFNKNFILIFSLTRLLYTTSDFSF